MTKNEIPMVDWIDKFDDSNYRLIFMESALRSMIQDGNIEESDIDEGISLIMRSLIDDYHYLLKIMKDYLQTMKTTAILIIESSIPNDGKDEKT